MTRSELSKALFQATLIVRRFVSGELSASAFVKEYANFYYYEALDGHEPSSAHDADERTRYWIPIELHRRIQKEIVNQLMLDSTYSREQLTEAGRIDETEARERTRAICADEGLKTILEYLEK